MNRMCHPSETDDGQKGQPTQRCAAMVYGMWRGERKCGHHIQYSWQSFILCKFFSLWCSTVISHLQMLQMENDTFICSYPVYDAVMHNAQCTLHMYAAFIANPANYLSNDAYHARSLEGKSSVWIRSSDTTNKCKSKSLNVEYWNEKAQADVDETKHPFFSLSRCANLFLYVKIDVLELFPFSYTKRSFQMCYALFFSPYTTGKPLYAFDFVLCPP